MLTSCCLTGYKIDIKSESDFDSKNMQNLEAIKDIQKILTKRRFPDRSAEPILDESEDFWYFKWYGRRIRTKRSRRYQDFDILTINKMKILQLIQKLWIQMKILQENMMSDRRTGKRTFEETIESDEELEETNDEISRSLRIRRNRWRIENKSNFLKGIRVVDMAKIKSQWKCVVTGDMNPKKKWLNCKNQRNEIFIDDTGKKMSWCLCFNGWNSYPTSKGKRYLKWSFVQIEIFMMNYCPT